MGAISVLNRQFEIAVKGRGRYRVPHAFPQEFQAIRPSLSATDAECSCSHVLERLQPDDFHAPQARQSDDSLAFEPGKDP